MSFPSQTPAGLESDPRTRRAVAVLGGGVTGLSAAWHLAQRGVRVRLFESAAQLGGPVQSTAWGEGWLAEAGPNSIQQTPELAALITALGLTDARVVASPLAKHRYLVRRGQLAALPLSPPAFLRSGLFSWGTKARVLGELLRRPRVRTTDVSVAAFIAAHFGREIVETAVDPFVSGIYAGHPDKLSARLAFPKLWELEQRHGSILRGQIAGAKARRASGQSGLPPIISFRDGLGMLPAALADALPAGSVERGARVQALLPGAPWRLVWQRGDAEPVTENFDRVVLALPARAMAELVVGTLAERPLAGLEAVEYAPVSSLFLGYRRADVAHPLDGFGLLVPSRERRAVLGVLFSSSLFAGRAPAGHVALTVMAGGARRSDLVGLGAEQLLAQVEPNLRELVGVRAAPIVMRLHAWPRAIPQYNLGYERFLDGMAQAEARFPGLLIGGSVRDGISLPNCLASGARLAEAALAAAVPTRGS